MVPDSVTEAPIQSSGTAPFLTNTTLYKGITYFALRRESVEFFLNDPKTKNFTGWFSSKYSPDETIWATLDRYQEFPFNANQRYRQDQSKYTKIRYIYWAKEDKVCHGKFQRGVCIFGTGDFSLIKRAMERSLYFANKFDFEVDGGLLDMVDAVLDRRRELEAADLLLESATVAEASLV